VRIPHTLLQGGLREPYLLALCYTACLRARFLKILKLSFNFFNCSDQLNYIFLAYWIIDLDISCFSLHAQKDLGFQGFLALCSLTFFSWLLLAFSFSLTSGVECVELAENK
jgi:hypothetical protein